jgi:hypothetical protein
MLDNICVKKGVMLGILNTILSKTQSIEHKNCSIVEINWKCFCNTTHNSGDTLPKCRACPEKKNCDVTNDEHNTQKLK